METIRVALDRKLLQATDKAAQRAKKSRSALICDALREQLRRAALPDDITEMARGHFGYGRWSAPYWFIGLEEGMGPDESLEQRCAAWRDLGGGELNDCRDYHANLRDKRWHCEKPSLQRTWRPLMLLLMAFLGRETDKQALRNYQREKWGRLHGETCVIELSGLPARSLKVPSNREDFREERIEVIREKMRVHRPKLVVMYGTSRRGSWEEIAGSPIPAGNILKNGRTIMAVTKHPVSRGLNNADWEKLGMKLRRLTKRA